MAKKQIEKKQPRKIRYSDSELSIIKNTFSENQEEVIRTLRKIFLQLPLDVLEQGMLDIFRASPQTLAVLRKTFLPTIEVDAPLHQIIDLWMTIDIKEKSQEVCDINIAAREKLINYIEQQLCFMEGGLATTEEIKFSDLTKVYSRAESFNTLTNLMARNTLLAHIEQQLQQLILLAGTKEESTEATLKRLAQDSTR